MTIDPVTGQPFFRGFQRWVIEVGNEEHEGGQVPGGIPMRRTVVQCSSAEEAKQRGAAMWNVPAEAISVVAI